MFYLRQINITLFVVAFITLTATTAYAVETDIISQIVSSFSKQTDKWYDKAQEIALQIFYWVLLLEIVMIGIRAAIGVSDLKEILKQFVMSVFSASFFLAVINNYQEWTINIVHGLQGVAGSMTKLERASDYPMKVGLDFAAAMFSKGSFLEPAETIILFLAALIILICFALITAKIILIKCEAIIATIAALILIPFGASAFFRDYAINTLRYILSVAFKLFTMQLVIGIGFSFLGEIKLSEINMSTTVTILGFVIVLLAISNSIPETVAGIINGSHVGSGASLMSAASSMRGATAAMTMMGATALGAAGGAWAAGKTLKGAHDLAKAQGSSGFTQTAASMGKNLWDARNSAKANNAPSSMQSELKEKLAALNLDKK